MFVKIRKRDGREVPSDRIVGDLAQAIEVVERITGQRPWLYRPAVGQVSPTVARACEQLGLTIVGWSARGFDGLKKAQLSMYIICTKV